MPWGGGGEGVTRLVGMAVSQAWKGWATVRGRVWGSQDAMSYQTPAEHAHIHQAVVIVAGDEAAAGAAEGKARPVIRLEAALGGWHS